MVFFVVTSILFVGSFIYFTFIIIPFGKIVLAQTNTWTLATGGFTLSDSTEISTSTGDAVLQQIDQSDDANDATGFSGGTHAATAWDATDSAVELDTMSDSILLYMNLDETSWLGTPSEVRDYSGNGNHGTIGGDPSVDVDTAKFVKSGYFGGGGAVVEVDDSSELRTAGVQTVSLWVMTSSTGATEIAAKGIAGHTKWEWAMNIDGSGNAQYLITQCAGSSVYAAVSGGVDMQDGNWHHVVGTSDADGAYIYVDGVLRGSDTSANGSACTGNVRPILFASSTHSSRDSFVGNMDDIRILDRKIEAREVSILYEQDNLAPYHVGMFQSRIIDASSSTAWDTFSVTTTEPYGKELPGSGATETGYTSGNADMTDNVLLYHMNETSGSISDSSGSAFTGTVSGGVTYANTGTLDTALGFDGDDDWVDVGDKDYDYITVEFWAKAIDITAVNIVSKRDKVGSEAWTFEVSSSKELGFWAYLGGAWRGEYAYTLTPNKWYHVAGTYDGTDVKLYVNGVLEGTKNYSGTTITNSDDSIRIGGHAGGTNDFEGYIDEVAIYSSALSASEILDHYKRGAMNIKYQIRSCDDSACSGESFVGSDGTTSTFYSDFDNATTGLPNLDIDGDVSDNRYMQYRAYYSTASSTITPGIKEVGFGPVHYYGDRPTVRPDTDGAVSYTSTMSGFTAVESGDGEVWYQITNAGDEASPTWYYWNGANWVSASAITDSNVSTTINSNIAQFPTDIASSGDFSWRAALVSPNGTEDISLTSATFTYNTAPTAPTTLQVRGLYGLSFDGNGDYVQISEEPKISPTNELSISLWVDVGSSSDVETIIEKNNVDTSGYGIFVTDQGYFCAYVNGANGIYGGATTNTYATNTFHHLVMTADADDSEAVKFYVNGTKETLINLAGKCTLTETDPIGDLAPSTADLYIGARTGSTRYLTGEVDEVEIYDDELTAGEVTTLYNSGLGMYSQSGGNLVAGYHFEAGSGSSAFDFSGNDFTGTLNGNTSWVGGAVVATTDISDLTPTFSAIYNDDSGDLTTKARIQVSKNSDMSSPIWDSDSGDSGTSIASTTPEGDRVAYITYDDLGSAATEALAFNTTYYWRIKYYDDDSASGAWATTANFTTVATSTAPASMSVSRESDTAYSISWSNSSNDENTFTIQRNASDAGWSTLTTLDANTTTYRDTSTTADAYYQYAVYATNIAGDSTSTTDSVTYYTTPGTPSGVTATYVDDSQFNITYTKSATVEDTHGVERCSNTDCDSNTYSGISGSPLESANQPHSDAGLSADSKYRWRVRSITPSSNVSSSYAYSSYEYTTPDAPTGSTATYSSDSSIALAWTDNAGFEDSNKIYTSKDGGEYTLINTTASNATSYTYAGASANSRYTFQIKSYIGATTANGEKASATTTLSGTIDTTPTAPTIASSTPDTTSIVWNFTDNAAYEDGFELYDGTNDNLISSTATANLSSVTESSLSVNTQYTRYVKAYNENASSTASVSEVTYTLAQPPSSASSVASGQQAGVISWNANGNPSGTEYYVENTTEGTSSGWITDTSWTSTGLRCSKSYSINIKARNGDNIETGLISTSFSTVDCSGGAPSSSTSGPSSPSSGPSNPAGKFIVEINGGAKYTNSKTVSLKFKVGSDTEKMSISDNEFFAKSNIEPYNEEKVWTLSDGDGEKTVYVKFYTGFGISSDVITSKIYLDQNAPQITNVEGKEYYFSNTEVIYKGNSEPFSVVKPTLNSKDVEDAIVDKEGSWSINLGKLNAGNYSLKLSPRDLSGNSGENKIFTFIVVDSGRDEIDEDVIPVEGKIILEPETIKEEEKDDKKKPKEDISLREQVAKKVDNLKQVTLKESDKLDRGDFVLKTPSQIIAESKLSGLSLSPVNLHILDLANKFPKLRSSLSSVGIDDLDSLSDIAGTKFYLPGLLETVGLSMEDLGTAGVSEGVGIALSDLDVKYKKKIPEEVHFVRASNGKIDLPTEINILEDGEVEHKTEITSGQLVELAVKPKAPAKAVRGYVLMHTDLSAVSSDEDDSLSLKLLGINTVHAEEDTEKEIEDRFVIDVFDYKDTDKDGIYTASIQTPVVDGKYEIITVVDYISVQLPTKEIRMTLVIDPEGYIYEKIDDKELRIPEAEVSIFWRNPSTGEFELWPAKNYSQKNPQITDKTGRYSFLVPEGEYYLKIETDGYKDKKTKTFAVTASKGVHMNVEIMKPFSVLSDINWRSIALVVIIILLGLNFYADKKRHHKYLIHKK